MLTDSRALAALGAEIVQADLSSLPSLVSAFSSANAIFVNTNFWEVYRSAMISGKTGDEASQLAYNSEINWGKNAATAALQVPELEKFVYSAFGSMAVASGGKYARCYHFEAKHVVVAHINDALPQLAAKTSYIYASAYADNPLMYPRRSGDGEYLMAFPGKASTKFPVFIPHTSTGGYVRCLIEDEPAGIKLLAVDWWIGMEEGMQAWERVTGQKSRFVEVTVQQLCQMMGLREEIIEGAAFLAEFPYMCEVKDYIEPKGLKNPPMQAMSFEGYLRTRDLEELLA